MLCKNMRYAIALLKFRRIAGLSPHEINRADVLAAHCVWHVLMRFHDLPHRLHSVLNVLLYEGRRFLHLVLGRVRPCYFRVPLAPCIYLRGVFYGHRTSLCAHRWRRLYAAQCAARHTARHTVRDAVQHAARYARCARCTLYGAHAEHVAVCRLHECVTPLCRREEELLCLAVVLSAVLLRERENRLVLRAARDAEKFCRGDCLARLPLQEVAHGKAAYGRLLRFTRSRLGVWIRICGAGVLRGRGGLGVRGFIVRSPF